MTGSAIELLDLVARWIHVIASIMWVGNSLLFNWLDRSLTPATAAGQTPKPSGTIWLLHSGGFYYVEKTLLDDTRMPAPLHWFKWQAYTTWLSGVALLIVVYYAGGRAVMSNSSASGLSHIEASAIGIGAIVAGWLLYELTQRFVAARAPAAAAVIWLTGFIAITIALTHFLDGRAAFIHVGAMLATIMAGNVALTIVPSQRELVASVSEGRGADAVVSARAKRVSIFNNYFTFPVVVLMVSSHFPSLYGHKWNWLLLLLLVATGAAVRYLLNIRWTFSQWKPVLAATIATSLLLLFLVMKRGTEAPAAAAAFVGPVTFEDARHVIDRRCGVCHSDRPTDLSLGVAPGGVMFDTRKQIEARAARILERAVVSRTMPPANKTGITDAERGVLAAWVRTLSDR